MNEDLQVSTGGLLNSILRDRTYYRGSMWKIESGQVMVLIVSSMIKQAVK